MNMCVDVKLSKMDYEGDYGRTSASSRGIEWRIIFKCTRLEPSMMTVMMIGPLGPASDNRKHEQ